MRHAMQYLHAFAFGKLIIGTIAVGLKVAFKVFEHFGRRFLVAPALIFELYHIIQYIALGPQPALMTAFIFLTIQYRHTRFICMKIYAGQYLSSHPLIERS